MRFLNILEYERMNEAHRKQGHDINFESTHPDAAGKFIRSAQVIYKYRVPKSMGTFSKVIDEYCTFDYINLIDG